MMQWLWFVNYLEQLFDPGYCMITEPRKREAKAVTIQDVAARVGVSTMTVSNVLSSSQSQRCHVSAETRLRVMNAVQELKYRPNANARFLRRQQTNIIGVYSDTGYVHPGNPFLSAVLGGLQEECDAHGKDLLVHGTFRGGSAENFAAELSDGRIDGLVIYAPNNRELVNHLANSSLPVIALADAMPELHSVVMDELAGGRMAAYFLADLGHRRLVCHYPEDAPLSDMKRKKSFIEGGIASHVDIMERTCTRINNDIHITESDANWLLMPSETRPTAAFCCNDTAAYDLLEHCHKYSIRVPEDVAIIGFDGVSTSRGGGRRVSTIRAPWIKAARTAVSLLVDLIQHKDIPRETMLMVELVLGDTT